MTPGEIRRWVGIVAPDFIVVDVGQTKALRYIHTYDEFCVDDIERLGGLTNVVGHFRDRASLIDRFTNEDPERAAAFFADYFGWGAA